MAGTSPATTRIKLKQSLRLPLSPEAASFQGWIGLRGRSRLVLDRHLGAEPLQLLRQRFVIGPRRLVLRIEFYRGAEIGQSAGPVALLEPEFASTIEDIGQR